MKRISHLAVTPLMLTVGILLLVSGAITTLAIPESRGRLRYYSRLPGLGKLLT